METGSTPNEPVDLIPDLYAERKRARPRARGRSANSTPVSAPPATVPASAARDVSETLRLVADELDGRGGVALRAFASGLLRQVPDRPDRT